MCVAIPGKVVEIIDDNTIKIDFGGVQRDVKSTLLDPKPKINDYVLVHIGFAMTIVDEKDALETLRLLAEIDSYNVNIEGLKQSE